VLICAAQFVLQLDFSIVKRLAIAALALACLFTRAERRAAAPMP